MKNKITTFSGASMPIRISRPMHASHIPYSLNQITKSLAQQVERHVVAPVPEEQKVEYDLDPTKPALSKKNFFLQR